MSSYNPLPGVTVQAGNIAEFVDGIYGERKNRKLEGAAIGAAIGYAVGRKFAGRNKKVKSKSGRK